jgi:glyoxylase-like metal-dependent hydrolase (beta-lactamase superfamily II)
MKKRLLQILGVLLIAAIPAYIWLFLESGAPAGAFPLDLKAVRQLASSLPGDKPVSIHVERVSGLEGMPSMGILAGSGWGKTDLYMYSYQLVFPASTGLVDVAMIDEGNHAYDPKALARVEQAMLTAGFIVITHEHYDHLGALTTHPELARVLPHTLLTAQQLSHPEKMKPAKFAEGALTGYVPLDYQGLHAVAPGVVLISSPGHTPGSQLVYVQQADGQEFLFLGDVAWHLDNVQQVKERARLVTLLIGEDRGEVLAQLATLHALLEQEPALHQVPGHDGQVVQGLIARKLLVPQFEAR